MYFLDTKLFFNNWFLKDVVLKFQNLTWHDQANIKHLFTLGKDDGPQGNKVGEKCYHFGKKCWQNAFFRQSPYLWAELLLLLQKQA